MLSKLKYRILEISYKHNLSHIGSCISCIDVLDEIYSKKKENEKVFLGNGHAGLALYVTLEKYYGFNAEEILAKYGIHATYAPEYKIYGSGGSLGMLEGYALGTALAKPNEDVYLISSDGGTAEGAFWEMLQIKSENKIDNLKLRVIYNGYAAYKETDNCVIARCLRAFYKDNIVDNIIYSTFFEQLYDIPFLEGQEAHYYKMKKEDMDWVEKNK